MEKTHFEIKVGDARVIVHQSFHPSDPARVRIVCRGEELTLVVAVDDPSNMSKVEIKNITD